MHLSAMIFDYSDVRKLCGMCTVKSDIIALSRQRRKVASVQLEYEVADKSSVNFKFEGLIFTDWEPILEPQAR